MSVFDVRVWVVIYPDRFSDIVSHVYVCRSILPPQWGTDASEHSIKELRRQFRTRPDRTSSSLNSLRLQLTRTEITLKKAAFCPELNSLPYFSLRLPPPAHPMEEDPVTSRPHQREAVVDVMEVKVTATAKAAPLFWDIKWSVWSHSTSSLPLFLVTQKDLFSPVFLQ